MTTSPAALLADLVAIDSVNPDLVGGGAGEAEIAAFVADWCRRAGLDVEVDEIRPGRRNVYARARGTGGGRTLLLNGHTDTVGVEGMPDPHRPRVEGERLYGRGASDMKNGLAAGLLATAELARRGRIRGDLIMTAVVDEEYASVGSEAAAASLRADAAIVLESSWLQICPVHKGFTWHEINVRGRAAHGSLHEVGVDAIAKTGRILTGIDELARRLREGPSHPDLGTGSVHASLIGGGQELSSYPQDCTLKLERRTIPGETPELVDAELQAIVDAAVAADPALDATVRRTFARYPLETQRSEPIVALLSKHTEAACGHAPAFVGGGGWTDAALFAGAGIPAVVWGPSGDGAHALEEWADLPSMERCVEVLVRVAEEFCG